jgi:glycosyltransferase involved in cell wall biosynthesis
VAGASLPNHLRSSEDPTVSWRPDVDDLTPLYDAARVFVAPTRYSAGISLKVVEAAARGVPVVCTPAVAEQLGWRPGIDLLTGGNPVEFAVAVASLCSDGELWRRLRESALARVARDYSATTFRSTVQSALNAAGLGSGRRMPAFSADDHRASSLRRSR